MQLSSKLLSHSVVYLSCELLAKLVPFIMLPYLTRVLSMDEFGRIGLINALQALVIIGINWSFEGGVIRYYYRYGRNGINSTLYASFILISSLNLFAIFISLIIDNDLLLLATLYAYLQAVFNLSLSVKQCQKKVLEYGLQQILFSIMSVGFTVLFFNLFEYTAKIRILALCLALLICSSACICTIIFNKKIKLIRVFNNRLAWSNIKYLVAFGLPLILHQLSLFSKGQLDRLVIADVYSLPDLAKYTASIQISSAYLVAITALNKASMPFYFEYLKNSNGKNKIFKWVLISLIAGAFPGGISLLLPDSFFTCVFGAKYVGLSYFVSIFMFGFGLQVPYLVLVNYLFFFNKTTLIAISTGVSSLAYLGILFILTGHGMKYIPLSMLISNLICLLTLSFFVRQHMIKMATI